MRWPDPQTASQEPQSLVAQSLSLVTTGEGSKFPMVVDVVVMAATGSSETIVVVISPAAAELVVLVNEGTVFMHTCHVESHRQLAGH
jgi:hypothetical protein